MAVLRVGGRFRMSTGLPYTPIVGVVGLSGSAQPVYGAPLSGTFPTFHQLDIRVDKRWVRDRTIVTAYLDVLNVYNHQNTEAYIYSTSYRQRIGGLSLPILPLFGVRVDI